MKKIVCLALTVMMLGISGVAVAENAAAPSTGTTVSDGKRTPAVRHRMKRQKKRIKQGIRSGELTKDEVKDLAADRKALKDQIKDAKSDGTVTKEERKQIHQDLNEESKKIYEKKHNDEKR